MAGRHAVEIELKYEVSARGGADGYMVAPELGPYRATGQVRSIRIEDRYVDTADWALARAGFAARLRTGSRGTIVSLKAAA
jgi:inorganic triphosphatase YgiF